MHLVIAHYNEDLLWLDNLLIKNPDFTYIIYSKGKSCTRPHIALENKGRESDTFLKYITDNYYNLPDRLVFLQGLPHVMPIDAFEEYFAKYANQDVYPMGPGRHITGLNNCDWPGMPLKELAIKLFGDVINSEQRYEFVGGAEYIVKKEVILKKTFDWWLNAYNLHKEYLDYPGWQTGSPWMFERLWPLIWYYTNI
jgi:hypothetical protein